MGSLWFSSLPLSHTVKFVANVTALVQANPIIFLPTNLQANQPSLHSTFTARLSFSFADSLKQPISTSFTLIRAESIQPWWAIKVQSPNNLAEFCLSINPSIHPNSPSLLNFYLLVSDNCIKGIESYNCWTADAFHLLSLHNKEMTFLHRASCMEELAQNIELFSQNFKRKIETFQTCTTGHQSEIISEAFSQQKCKNCNVTEGVQVHLG